MSTTDPDPAVQNAVEGYADRLAELITSCSMHQRRDPEVFLWNARRALEAICHIPLSVNQDQLPVGKPDRKEITLEGMIQKLQERGVLDRTRASQVNSARELTNQGVHFRQPWKEDCRDAMGVVPLMLANIVGCLVKASPAATRMTEKEELLHEAEDRVAALERGIGDLRAQLGEPR